MKLLKQRRNPQYLVKSPSFMHDQRTLTPSITFVNYHTRTREFTGLRFLFQNVWFPNANVRDIRNATERWAAFQNNYKTGVWK